MSDSKDETGKASGRPGEAGVGKRPYATLDLQATEVAGERQSAGAEQPGPDTQSETSAAADGASTLSAAARRASALAAHMQSGSFLSHVGAGVVGALLVSLLGYLLLPLQKLDPQHAADAPNLARRLADAEAVLGTQSGDANGLVARVDDLVRSVRSLDVDQGKLAAQAKELASKIGAGQAGTQEVPPDVLARLSKLEQSASGQSGAGAGETAAKAAVAAVDREIAGIRTDAGRLSQRLDNLRADLEERLRGAARTADLGPLEARLVNLESALQALQKTEGDRTANAARALLSLELASLKRVMDRGEPFAGELATVRKAAAGKVDLMPLERYMGEGVPTLADIGKSFRKVADAMQDAEAVPPDASLVDRLLSGARSIVRVRKAGHSADDTSLEATIARMETALKENRLAEVLEQGKLLPPKAALAAEEWLRQVEARHAVDRAMAGIEDSIKTSLVGKPAGAEIAAMTRLVTFLLTVLVVAAGLHWLAARPGTIVVEWQDHIAETTVFRAFIILALAIGLIFVSWSLLRHVWSSPAYVGRMLHRRRQKRGLDALSGGIIAIGAGDRTSASRYASQARKALPNEPLTHLLRAQTAQLTGDRTTARRIFEAMLASPDTEQLGLRGLFLEAQREGEGEAARQFAERAVALNPKLEWPAEALFDLQCRAGDWAAALETLAVGRRNGLIDKTVAARRRAVLLTAQAQAAEDGEANKALELALEAHRLARNLVPASAIAGRILASRGQTARAARVMLKTWRLAPHPELAAAYAHARPGDSPRDRLVRVRHLGRITPDNVEAPLAIAVSAIEAREWDEARKVLEPLLEARLTQRVCTLMARIEAEQHGHTGRVREWLARAVNAPRDPAWTADGVVADHWSPVSPVTGALDAFRWRVPVELVDAPSGARLSAKVEALVGLGAPTEPVIEHADTTKPPAATVTAETIEVPRRTAELPAPRPKIAEPAAEPLSARIDLPVADQRPALRAEARAETQARELHVPKPAEPSPQKTATADRDVTLSKPTRPRKPAEPKIFVAPRAPDDPGPDAAEGDGIGPGPFGPSPVKI